MAKRARISDGAISRIMSGSRNAGEETIKAIARALKLPPEQVFRAAGLLPPKPDDDPWVEEMSHKLTLIPPNLRDIARNFIESVAADEEEDAKPKTRKAKKGV